MIERILRWLAGLLAGILEKFSDPNLQSKLDAYQANAAAANQLAKEAETAALQSEAAYRESAARRAEWDARLQQSREEEAGLQQDIGNIERKIQELKQNAADQKALLDRMSDSDVLGKPL